MCHDQPFCTYVPWTSRGELPRSHLDQMAMFTRWWPMVSLCLLVLLVPCSGVVVHFSVPIGRSRDPRATALIRELLQEPPASLPSLMGRNLELLLNAEFMATLDDQIGSSSGAARTALEDLQTAVVDFAEEVVNHLTKLEPEPDDKEQPLSPPPPLSLSHPPPARPPHETPSPPPSQGASPSGTAGDSIRGKGGSILSPRRANASGRRGGWRASSWEGSRRRRRRRE